MKLYYFKDPRGNFGDDLNPWLWERLLPDFFNADGSRLLVGIGTLLNHRLPSGAELHVFGSGFGYGRAPTIDSRFVFHAVRGFETARALGLDRALAITDPAVLVRTVALPPPPPNASAIGFIPHCQSSRNFEWETVCRDIGLKYISTEWGVDKVIAEMRTCQTLVCEAMHGAIVADALRIPWIPVSCYDYISDFKWKDWLSTVNLPYEPLRITSLYDVERHSSTTAKLKNCVKRGLLALNTWSDNWTPPPPRATGSREYDQATNELAAGAKSRTYLSDDATIARHTERYSELVEYLKRKRWQ